jgi:hypothetical protein
MHKIKEKIVNNSKIKYLIIFNKKKKNKIIYSIFKQIIIITINNNWLIKINNYKLIIIIRIIYFNKIIYNRLEIRFNSNNLIIIN